MSSGDLVTRLGRRGLLIDGRYRLDELLGAGGFGEVWRARQEVEGAEVRTVALKLLVPPGGDGGTGTLSTVASGRSGGSHTWLDEVRAVREVHCTSITTIYDVGIARDPRVAFIAMELLHGETLGDRLRGGPMYWRRALAIARPVAEALVVCHRAGVAHCDLKPANVFLGAGGAIHVLDFGVASLGGKRRDVAAANPDAPGGATGAVDLDEMPDLGVAVAPSIVVGTPGYIAPELFHGDVPGPSGDAYALGVMLFRAIAGKLPHRVEGDHASFFRPDRDGDAPEALASLARPHPSPPAPAPTTNDYERWHAALNTATIRGETWSLADAAPGVPPAVTALVDRLLSVRPEDRPVADLAVALEDVWLRPWGVPDPPYVGLAAFDQRRAGHIAGRDGDVDAIATMLATRRALVLAGPSGCGKSSLAVAGVVPRIDRDLLDGVDGWVTVTVRPSEGARALSIGDLAPAAPDSFVAGPAAARSGGGGDGGAPAAARLGIAVVIDQLEELLRLPADERDRFALAMIALAEGRAPVVVRGTRIEPGAAARVIATVRDDLFGAIAALPALERLPERNLFTVRGVAPSALAELVEGPARAAGFTLEGAADVVGEARRILDVDPGALPLVQFALTRWWEQRDVARKVLPRAVWQAIGGIEGALAEAAETVWGRLAADERPAMRALLVSLFRPDGTRIRVAESALAGDDVARRVLAHLVEQRLVTRLEDDAGLAWLEVVHEALGRRWPALRSWLDETRAERELLADCEDDATTWQRNGRAVDLLWRGARLAAAFGVRERLSGQARAFVEAGGVAAGRQRWTRRAVGAALAMLMVAAAVLVVSFVAANRQRERAGRARVDAERARGEADGARVAADAARKKAEEDAAESRREREAAQSARVEAERERDQARGQSAENRKLRDEAMRAAASARTAESRAIAERAETVRQSERVREAVERAETERRRAESERIYAETAQRLHEVAASRLADVEERSAALQSRVRELGRDLEQCRAEP